MEPRGVSEASTPELSVTSECTRLLRNASTLDWWDHEWLEAATLSACQCEHRSDERWVWNPRWTPPHGLGWVAAALVALVLTLSVLTRSTVATSPSSVQLAAAAAHGGHRASVDQAQHDLLFAQGDGAAGETTGAPHHGDGVGAGTTTTPSGRAARPRPLAIDMAIRFQKVANRSCREAGLWPIVDEHTCKAAARNLSLDLHKDVTRTNDAERPEGCYFFTSGRMAGGSLWMGINPSSKEPPGGGPSVCSISANATQCRYPICASQELLPKLRLSRQYPSLYCFTLSLPAGYEPELLKAQLARRTSIFACDEFMAFSSTTILLGREVMTVPIDHSLIVPYGGKWGSALNTDVFIQVWKAVARLGRYKAHDWTVKVDPDAVFLADRLQALLRESYPLDPHRHVVVAPRPGKEPSSAGRRSSRLGLAGPNGAPGGASWPPRPKAPRVPATPAPTPTPPVCGNCRLENFEEDACVDHLGWLQGQGRSCQEALEQISRAPPEDCGCGCTEEDCNGQEAWQGAQRRLSSAATARQGALYLNNCEWGLRGSIEVLSRQAVDVLIAGYNTSAPCQALRSGEWGEDKWLRQCLDALGVAAADEAAGLLSELACGEQPVPCDRHRVAFHPFKTVDSYMACLDNTMQYQVEAMLLQHDEAKS